MKRKIAFVVVMLVLCGCLAACTARFERGVKDFKSNVSGGLERKITAYSMTGEKIGEWSGKVDIEFEDNKVKFDMDGKRVIISNAIVITEEE